MDFSHDITGIRGHINRDTGKLEDFFIPRYALSYVDTTPYVDITPVGLQNQDGIRRVNAATEAFENATALVANTTSEFLDENRITLLEVARGSSISDSDRKALRESLHQLDAAVGARRRKQEILLRAVAGAPPAPDERPEDTIIQELEEAVPDEQVH